MKTLGVIPARLRSTRLPEKPLHSIAGRPLLAWVIENMKLAVKLDSVVVATDDQRVADLALSCGAEAMLTDPELPSGTDRVWAVAAQRDEDLIVNIQGDEPLLAPGAVDALVSMMHVDSAANMGTLATRLEYEELENKNVVKVLVDQRDNAIYFSRFGIPFSRISGEGVLPSPKIMKHIGVYAYKRAFLESFCATSPVIFEKAESLEQLRALDMGAKIKVVRTDSISVGVDTLEDARKVESILRKGK